MRLLTHARSRRPAVVLTLGPIALGIVLGLCGAAWGQCEQAKLTASDTAFSDEFGVSVSTSGDVAVIGAHHDADGGSSPAPLTSTDSIPTRQDGTRKPSSLPPTLRMMICSVVLFPSLGRWR